MKFKKQIRKGFREGVFERDGNKCVFCAVTENLDAHHITDRHHMPNGGYVKENGITLCPIHHLKAEKWHMTNGRDCEDGMSPTDLYKKINSSFKLARDASDRLR